MRYDESRYGGDNDFVLTRRQLTPAQITQIQVGLQSNPADDTTYPQIVANQDNFALADRIVHLLTSDASRNITGFVNVGVGLKVIVNRGSFDIVLVNDSASSTAENRILCTTGANITLTPGRFALIFYDRESARVRASGPL